MQERRGDKVGFSFGFQDLLKDKDQLVLLHRKYVAAKPFPHLVLDDVFNPLTLMELKHAFPAPDPSWWKYDNALERKFAKDDLSEEAPCIQATVALLQSRKFTDFLEAVTGIQGLIVDQTLRGGGLHQIARGGKLDIHVDHNYHAVTKLDRRLNVILYLNQGWQEDWKGHLELWNRDLSVCGQRILPVLGRMVIFNTTDWSWHGHADELQCPEGVTRKSLALYYWTNGRPDEERSAPHSTVYRARPQDSKTPEMEQLRKQRAKGRLN